MGGWGDTMGLVLLVTVRGVCWSGLDCWTAGLLLD